MKEIFMFEQVLVLIVFQFLAHTIFGMYMGIEPKNDKFSRKLILFVSNFTLTLAIFLFLVLVANIKS